MGMHGRKHSPETIERMRASAMARRYTPEGAERHRTAKLGERNPQWKGGRFLNAKGYVMIRMPDSPMANMKGYVPEHRLVIATALGRPLLSSEHVHHVNEDTADNRIENLALTSVGEHTRIHHAGAKRSEETRAKLSLVRKGNTNRLGKRHTEATKAKISATKRRKRPE